MLVSMKNCFPCDPAFLPLNHTLTLGVFDSSFLCSLTVVKKIACKSNNKVIKFNLLGESKTAIK